MRSVGADYFCCVVCVCVCVCRFKVLVDMRACGEANVKEYTLGRVGDNIYVNELYGLLYGDGVAPDVRFMHHDQVITPDEYFSEYGIESGDTITIFPRGRGGMDAGAGYVPSPPPPARLCAHDIVVVFDRTNNIILILWY